MQFNYLSEGEEERNNAASPSPEDQFLLAIQFNIIDSPCRMVWEGLKKIMKLGEIGRL